MSDRRNDDDVDRTGLAALVARSVGERPQPVRHADRTGVAAASAQESATSVLPMTGAPSPAARTTLTRATGPNDTPVRGVPIIEGVPDVRPHRWRRRIVRTVALLFLAGVVYYGVTLFQVWTVGRSDQARPVDALVVMGAAQYDGTPSPQLRARLDHVAELWSRQLAQVVVVTGGNQPGDRFTEAGASAGYLAEHGVPPEAILQEDSAHNSYDSLVGVRDLLRARGLSSVLLVSDPYHSLRIRLSAQELGLTAYVSPTRSSPVQGARAFWHEAREAAGIALGRIIGFDRLLSLTG